MSPSRIRWGVLLILIGGTFLAINLGYLSWWVWIDLLYLWPVLLIAIGLEMIVRKTRIEWIGYLSAVMLVGCFIWAIDQNGGFSASAADNDSLSRTETHLEYNNEQATKVVVNFSGGRLYVNSGEEKLLRVNSLGPGNRIAMKSNCSGGRCDVELGIKAKGLFRRTNFGSGDNYWKCYLKPGVDFSSDFQLDDTDLRFFAQDLRIPELNIKADHSDVLVRLGSGAANVVVRLSGRSTDLEVILPDSVGVKLESIELPVRMREALGISERGGYLANDLFGVAAVNFTIVGNLDNSKLNLSYFQTQPSPEGSI